MRIVKFQASHLHALELQDAQRYFCEQVAEPGYGEALASTAHCFTGLDGDKVVGCAGVYEIWPGRAVAWALLSRDAGAHFRTIHRAALGFIAQAPWRRIEAVVEDGFEAGHRWARMLGMQREGLMRAYSPGGVDFYLYSRVRDGQ